MSRDRMLAPPISTVGTMIRTKPATSRDCGLIMSLLSHLYFRKYASCHPRERCALSKAYSAECVEGKFCELRHSGVLRSSLATTSNHKQRQRYAVRVMCQEARSCYDAS